MNGRRSEGRHFVPLFLAMGSSGPQALAQVVHVGVGLIPTSSAVNKRFYSVVSVI